MLSVQELKNNLFYDSDTGSFTWISVRPYGKYKVGDTAGHLEKSSGYVKITLNSIHYKAHRLAWLYVYGNTPNIIDHIDGNRANNKIENLRNATNLINSRNQKKNKNNKSGVSGVHLNGRDSKWYVTVSVLGKKKFLGSFDSVDDAINTRIEYNKLNGFSDTHGARER